MWLPISSAPLHETVVVYGYELQPVSGLRVEESYQVAFASRSYTGEWMLEVSEEDPRQVEFEPLGWRPTPELPDAPTDLPEQPIPLNPPLYRVGDQVLFRTRYDGLQLVTITSVVTWPKGHFYGLSIPERWESLDLKIGAPDLDFDCYGTLYSRPAREDELKPPSEASESLGAKETNLD